MFHFLTGSTQQDAFHVEQFLHSGLCEGAAWIECAGGSTRTHSVALNAQKHSLLLPRLCEGAGKLKTG